MPVSLPPSGSSPISSDDWQRGVLDSTKRLSDKQAKGMERIQQLNQSHALVPTIQKLASNIKYQIVSTPEDKALEKDLRELKGSVTVITDKIEILNKSRASHRVLPALKQLISDIAFMLGIGQDAKAFKAQQRELRETQKQLTEAKNVIHEIRDERPTEQVCTFFNAVAGVLKEREPSDSDFAFRGTANRENLERIFIRIGRGETIDEDPNQKYTLADLTKASVQMCNPERGFITTQQRDDIRKLGFGDPQVSPEALKANIAAMKVVAPDSYRLLQAFSNLYYNGFDHVQKRDSNLTHDRFLTGTPDMVTFFTGSAVDASGGFKENKAMLSAHLATLRDDLTSLEELPKGASVLQSPTASRENLQLRINRLEKSWKAMSEFVDKHTKSAEGSPKLENRLMFRIGVGPEAKKVSAEKTEVTALSKRIVALKTRLGAIEDVPSVTLPSLTIPTQFMANARKAIDLAPSSDEQAFMKINNPTGLELLEGKLLRGESVDVSQYSIHDLSEMVSRMWQPKYGLVANGHIESMRKLNLRDLGSLDEDEISKGVVKKMETFKAASPESYKYLLESARAFDTIYLKTWDPSGKNGVLFNQYAYTQQGRAFVRLWDDGINDNPFSTLPVCHALIEYARAQTESA